MFALVVFALTLLLAVRVSKLADRTALSTSVMFLAAGLLVGGLAARFPDIEEHDYLVQPLARLALVGILFADGMQVELPRVRATWHHSARALLIGLPLTFLGNALVAAGVAGVAWREAWVLGAVLTPTDPVFAAAIIDEEEVPSDLRNVLNFESGLNDGIMLPVVLALMASPAEGTLPLWLGELGLGIALGVGIAWAATRLGAHWPGSVSEDFLALEAFGIGLLVLAVSSLTGANVFLASFFAGMAVNAHDPEVKKSFGRIEPVLMELLKFGAVFIFGTMVFPEWLVGVDLRGWLFAALVLVLVRPLALLGVAFVGSSLGPRERVVAAWFGPKGFASVAYGLMALGANGFDATRVFQLTAATVTLSIVAHSSTDVLLARWLERGAGPTE